MKNYELIQSKIEAGIEAAKKEIEVRNFKKLSVPVMLPNTGTVFINFF
jgi:hypothetical protein